MIVPRWVLIALTVGAMLPWSAILTRSDDDLHVFFLDVGQGDAIFIRGKAGKVLIDGGPSPQRILAHLGRLMPFWDRRLDYVVLTHAHADHVTGLVEVLDRFEVRGTVEGSSRGDDAVYKRWEELASRSGHQRITAERGLRLRLGDQAEITVLYSPDEPLPQSGVNESSVALRLTAPAVTLMLMGDLAKDGQANLLTSSKVPTSTILKVPHHGSQDSLNEEFLRAVSPRVSVISVGADNRFGHPAVSTLGVLSRTQILRTDERGTIEVVTNGRSYWLKPER